MGEKVRITLNKFIDLVPETQECEIISSGLCISGAADAIAAMMASHILESHVTDIMVQEGVLHIWVV